MTCLGLGTVQFGIDYGVTNVGGQVTEAEVVRILDKARKAGVEVLDTAALYGTSEEVLGRCGVRDFRIVTKTPRLGGDAGNRSEIVARAFETSLANLGVERVYGLLAHHAPDLLGAEGGVVMGVMRDLRQRGLVARIGASIYSGHEIDALLERYDDIDLVQIPLNVLDQRLVKDGQIRRLIERGVEIHARSAFLQGLLLDPSRRLADGMSGLYPYLEAWRDQVGAHDISFAQAALGFLKSVAGIEVVVVGVTNVSEFDELVAAFQSAQAFPVPQLACNDPALVDPSRWARG